MNKVLLVDDEPHVIYVLKQMLEKNGYEVSTANNGRKALDMVESLRPNIIITDIQMPQMTGQELCVQLNDRFPDPDRKIIIMTSRTDNNFRTWASEMDNLEFLEKPLSPRHLLATLRNYNKTAEERMSA